MKNIKNIFKSELLRNASILVGGNVTGQAIALLVYPLLTRIYTKEDLGLYALFTSIISVLSILATGKYGLAIVLPKEDKKAISLFQLCMILNIAFFAISILVTLLFGNEIGHLFNQEKLIPVLPLLPFFVLLSGYWQTLNYYYIRQKKYHTLSTFNIMQSGFNSVLKYFLGYKNLISYGLIWGQLVGQFLAIVISTIAGKFSLRILREIKKNEIVTVAKEFSNFPKYELPNELINVLAYNLPVLILSAYFDMAQIGLFTLALTIGLNPVILFGSSIGLALYKKMSDLTHDNNKLMNECILFCKTCVLIILPVFILVLFAPEKLFEILFGQEWGKVGFYLKVMLPCLFVSFFVSAFSSVPDIFFKQKTAMNIEIVYIVLKIISLIGGIYYKNFNLGIILYYGTATLMLTIKLIWYFRLIRKYDHSLR